MGSQKSRGGNSVEICADVELISEYICHVYLGLNYPLDM